MRGRTCGPRRRISCGGGQIRRGCCPRGRNIPPRAFHRATARAGRGGRGGWAGTRAGARAAGPRRKHVLRAAGGRARAYPRMRPRRGAGEAPGRARFRPRARPARRPIRAPSGAGAAGFSGEIPARRARRRPSGWCWPRHGARAGMPRRISPAAQLQRSASARRGSGAAARAAGRRQPRFFAWAVFGPREAHLQHAVCPNLPVFGNRRWVVSPPH